MLARSALALAALCCIAAAPAPRLVRDGQHVRLEVDGEPFFVIGAQMHNSSAWPSRMPAVWQAVQRLGANTLEAPVYWQTLEPAPDRFDFAEIDMLIDQARAHHVRLALLWFGSWKNGAGHYAPDWIKADDARYPRLRDAGGRALDGISPFASAAIARDAHAFATLMAHLRDRDGVLHTVILVQVENEPGLLGTVRDHGKAADAAFAGPVPQAVLQATGRSGASWQEAFGAGAEEAFSAAAVAADVERVAEAGRAVYPLPFSTNVWLRYRGLTQPGTEYPSGGAVSTMLPIWKALTPAIGLLTPDLYTNDFPEFAAAIRPFDRPDNPLLVSESGVTEATARWVFAVLGEGGLGCSIFGIDGDPATPDRLAALAAHADNDHLLAPMATLLSQAAAEGRITAFVQQPGGLSPSARIGDWQVGASFGGRWGETAPATMPAAGGIGRALVVRLDETHWIVAGMAARIDIASTLDDGRPHEVVSVEQGRMDRDGFHRERLLNGDETDSGLMLDPRGETLRVTLMPSQSHGAAR